jgi:hypothetical protein
MNNYLLLNKKERVSYNNNIKEDYQKRKGLELQRRK